MYCFFLCVRSYLIPLLVALKHTWYESLRQKMKDERGPLVKDDKVQEMKLKYGERNLVQRTASNPLDLTDTNTKI